MNTEDSNVTDLERHRLMQAEELFREAGYVQTPDGDWIPGWKAEPTVPVTDEDEQGQ